MTGLPVTLLLIAITACVLLLIKEVPDERR